MPLDQVCTQGLSEQETQAMVWEYWVSGSGWNWSCLSNLLPHLVLLKLASISINPLSFEGDKLNMLTHNGGAFTVKSTYELEVGGVAEGRWEGWKLIWSLRVQQGVKVFVWLLVHEGVLTNHSRWHRGHSMNSNCSHCLEEREDSIHMIRDFGDSKKVWDLFGSSLMFKDFFSLNLRGWFFSLNLRD